MNTRSEEREIDGRTVVIARPDGDGPWPGVVMLHEAFGIDDVLRRQADRLASAGYLVAAPDLFGEGFRLGCMISTIRAYAARRGRPFEVIDAVREARDPLQVAPRAAGEERDARDRLDLPVPAEPHEARIILARLPA